MQALCHLVGVQRRRRHGVVRLLRPERSATSDDDSAPLPRSLDAAARARAGAHPMATMSQSRASAMKCCTKASSGCAARGTRRVTSPRRGLECSSAKRAAQRAGCMTQRRTRERNVKAHRRVAEVEGANEDAQLAREGRHASRGKGGWAAATRAAAAPSACAAFAQRRSALGGADCVVAAREAPPGRHLPAPVPARAAAWRAQPRLAA